MKIRILWLAPAALRFRLRPELAQTFQLLTVQSLSEALMFLRTCRCEVIVMSCAEAGSGCDDALLELRRLDPSTPVVVDLAKAAVTDAVRLTKLGAYDVWVGEPEAAHMLESLQSAAFAGRAETPALAAAEEEPWRAGLVGRSDCMERVADVIRLVAARRSTVLITGETGTGKEVVARAIHTAGGRGNLPFVAVNCAAIPENLIEAELFGYARGAFTGAVQSRPGRFEQANGGTLFLDEIGELSPAMQVKLLRVLQEREVQRLGSTETVRLNLRFIAATNLDLHEAVRSRAFREDLYYRLNVVPLHLPPLRERSSDVPALISHFLDKICRSEGMGRKTISPAALRELSQGDWPGNIRQLEHAVEMAVVLSGDRAVLDPSDFSVVQQAGLGGGRENAALVRVPDGGLDFDETVSTIERSLLRQALKKSGGNKAKAAELLRMKRTTLLAKIKVLCEDLEVEEIGGGRLRPALSQGFLAAAAG